MHRTQIRLILEQARDIKRLATREGNSVAELIHLSMYNTLCSDGPLGPDVRRQTDIDAAGKLHGGPDNLSAEHDRYLFQDLEESHAG